MLKLEAPAKLNLTLEVLGRRSDGYHDISSIVQTISLCDYLTLEGSREMAFHCDQPGWRLDMSLVPRAANLLREGAGYAGGAVVHLAKRIPLKSGLGGDSSDAAACLRGLNRLWRLGIPPGELVHLASRLGSDVPFFIFGGTAMVQGRGELVSPLPPLGRMWVVLLSPPVSRPESKTATLYSRLREEHFTDGRRADAVVTLLTQGESIGQENLFNVFESVAYDVFAGLDRYRAAFLEAGAASVHLAGSGPALFSLHQEKAGAGRVYDSLKLRGMEPCLVETLGDTGLERMVG